VAGVLERRVGAAARMAAGIPRAVADDQSYARRP
jgi:hypothetical protein